MPETKKILVVEDDIKIVELLRDYLGQSGFEVSALYNGDQVIRDVKLNPPDLIILDIMLPYKDGITICRELRNFSKVPIIIISAKTEEIDRVLGLELGADDFICKPFSLREVVARIKAILRRTKPEEEKLIAGPIIIYNESFKVIAGKDELQLTPSEFELLKTLASEPCNVFTRSDLVSKLQASDSKVYNGEKDNPFKNPNKKTNDSEDYHRTIDSHIRNLRIKIEKALPANNLIQTIYGIGYSFNLSGCDNISDD